MVVEENDLIRAYFVKMASRLRAYSWLQPLKGNVGSRSFSGQIGTTLFVKQRLYVIDVNDENVDYLEREDCGVVLGELWEREQARLAALPPTEELARRYGESSSRLYAFRDIEWKLRASYYAEHEPAAVREWLDPSVCRVRLG